MSVRLRPFTLEESVRFVLAASRVRDEIDTELGDLMLHAHDTDSPDDWSAVHDRLNVLGDFPAADRIRSLFDR